MPSFPRFALFAFVLALFALVLPAAAGAAGTPDISLDKEAPEQALLGTNQRVTLTAANPENEVRGYNLSFRDVLPVGVEFVPGSVSPTGVEAEVIEGKPNAGETTLLFRNVADLSQNSHYALSFEVKPTPGVLGLGQTYEDRASAFVNEEPRFEPKFDSEGQPINASTSYTGSAEDTASTKLTAIEIEKIEPSPEHELLRGVHEQQTVYTLKLRNNKVAPTKELTVDDYLPAGLEFLGCGEVDHTTKTKTNELGANPAEEYPGSGPIFPGNDPAAPQCREPDLVETELVDPPGLEPEGVYTHVHWEGLGELGPGDETEIQYRAAVPILRNTLGWTNGKPPGALAQAANLDNNTGEETEDEEALTNVARVEGKFEGTADVEDTDQLKVTAEDLAIQKSVSPTTINSGDPSTWKFELETSEYRYVKDISIKDELPNGLCPLGKENYENPIQPQAECDNPGGLEPTAEYGSVEELPNGEFLIEWDKEKAPALAEMGPSEKLTIEFPTQTRVYYQKDFENDEERPVLTHDSWVNQVDMGGADFARCAPNDPRCTEGEPPIASEEEEGTQDFDESEAAQQAAGVHIDKKVRLPDEDVPVDCETGTYVDGPAPSYRPGDEVCWQVRVDFAADLFAGEPLVTDFLPPDEKYVAGSAQPVSGVNTVSVENFTENGNALEWTLGQSVPLGSKVFAYRFKSIVGRSTSTTPFDVEGNLMKFASANSAGETFPERDEVDIEREEPELKIVKGVYQVGGNAVGGEEPSIKEVKEEEEDEPSFINDQNATGAQGGEIVKYGIQLENTGNLEAEAIEVWDGLPAGIECADVSAISDGGTCDPAKNVIVWTGLAVAERAMSSAVTYEVKLPSDVAPDQSYKNTVGVRQFESPTNTGTPFEYFPGNIDPIFSEGPPANTGAIEDTATVSTEAAALLKTRETTIEQEPGNNLPDQATIGEKVKYALTATIPAGTVLSDSPKITDPLGPRLELIENSVKGSVKGTAIGTGLEGFTVAEEGGNPVLHFPVTYTNPEGSGADTIVLEFEARVTDVSTNNRVVGVLTNEGVLTYKDQAGTAVAIPDSVSTTIVEPKVTITKSHAGGKIVEPGDIVNYTVTAHNSGETRVSTANESVVTDTVPKGMAPVNGETPVLDGEEVTPNAGTWHENPGGGGTITWTIPTLAPGASEPLEYDLRVNNPANAGSVFKNTATITTTSLAGAEPGERTASSPSHVGYEAEAKSEVTLDEAKLEKSVEAPEGTTIGDPLTYELHLKLLPNVRYFDTTVEDQLPKGVVYDPPAESPEITCTPNCADVAAAGIELAPKSVNGALLLGWYFSPVASSEEERTVTIVYHAHIGQELEAGVRVEDGAHLENKAIGLYNGEEKRSGPPAEPPARSEFTNKTNEPSAFTDVTEPELAIDKAVSGETLPPEETQPGDEYVYTLTVTNNGDSAAYDVVVKDDNPEGVLRNLDPKAGGLEGESLLVPGWSEGDQLEWRIPGEIAPGASVNLQYKGDLAPSAELHDGDTIVNTADIPVYFGEPKAQRTREGESRFHEYTEDPEDTVTLKTSLPKPKVVKTVGTEGANEADAEIGKPFTWQVKVTNEASAAELKGVDLVDILPEGWQYISGSAEFAPGGTVEPTTGVNGEGKEVLSWTNITDLAHGASFTLTFESLPTTALEDAVELGEVDYINNAVASGVDASGAPESAEEEPYKAEDSAEAELQAPGLHIVKKPDAGEPAAEAIAGEGSSYTITVENESGTGPATEVEVSDLLGPGNGYTAGGASAELEGGGPVPGFEETSVSGSTATETLVKWKIPTIPAGQNILITVPVSLAPTLADGTTLVDQAKVKSAQHPTEVEDGGALEVKREAEIKLTKTGPATAVAGNAITYHVHVENEGPSQAENVVVTDELPLVTRLIKAEGCLASGHTLTCALGNLEAHAARDLEMEVEVEPSGSGAITNLAEVESPTFDPEHENNHDEVVTTVETEADVAIHKSGPTAPVLLGSTFSYTLEVENHEGPSDAEAVTVEDQLPPELEPLAADSDTGSCVAPPEQTVECDLGTMAPGEKAVIHVTVKAIAMPAGPEGVVNKATVATTTEDPEPTNDESEVKTTVEPAADLAITKTAPASVPAGGEFKYNLHVEDLGPSDGTEVEVGDPLPAGTQFVSASEDCSQAEGKVTCKVGELKVGESRDYEITVKVPLPSADHDLVNTATVEGHEADPKTEDNSSTVTTKAGPAADLSITKTMGKAQAGEPLTYTLAITDHGPSASSAVTVKDSLPAGTTFKSAAPSQGTCSAAGQSVTCHLGGLAAGASAQVSITVDVADTVTGSLRNLATVEGPEPDPDKNNNESSVEGPGDPAPPTVPNLRVVKTADTSNPQVGVPFDYHVAITNLSGASANNVKVVDTLDGPVEVVSVDSQAGQCEAKGSKILCTIPSIAVGKTVHVTYSVVARSAGRLSNTASAQASNGEKAPSNNHAVKSVKAKVGKGAFSLTKKASRKVVGGGKKVGFLITLRNGPAALINATVCDRLPAALVFVKAPGARYVNGEACWTNKYVAAHKVLRLHLVARAVKGYQARHVRNVATAKAANASRRSAAAKVRIRPAFAGKPGGVTG